MTIVNQYYMQSELSQAAYGTYSVGAIDSNLLTGKDVGMTDVQATDFASRWRVVDQFTSSGVTGRKKGTDLFSRK